MRAKAAHRAKTDYPNRDVHFRMTAESMGTAGDTLSRSSADDGLDNDATGGLSAWPRQRRPVCAVPMSLAPLLYFHDALSPTPTLGRLQRLAAVL